MIEWLITVGVMLAPCPVLMGSLFSLCALKARSATFMIIDPHHIEAHNQANAVVPDLIPQKKKKSGVPTFPSSLMVAAGIIVCLIYIVGTNSQVPSQLGSGLMMLNMGIIVMIYAAQADWWPLTRNSRFVIEHYSSRDVV